MFDGLDTSVIPHFVSRQELPRWAEKVRPALQCMADGSAGRYLAEDIYLALACGRMQLWLALDGVDLACVMVTEVVEYPRLKAMRCTGIWGHRPRRWLHLLADVERAARDCFGCAVMEAFVQPGLDRLLRTGGWSLFHGQYQKALV